MAILNNFKGPKFLLWTKSHLQHCKIMIFVTKAVLFVSCTYSNTDSRYLLGLMLVFLTNFQNSHSLQCFEQVCSIKSHFTFLIMKSNKSQRLMICQYLGQKTTLRCRAQISTLKSAANKHLPPRVICSINQSGTRNRCRKGSKK